MKMIKKILVPVDGSAHMSKAIEFAAHMARIEDAVVHLLHVVKLTRIPEELDDYIRAEKIKESSAYLYINLLGNRIIGAANCTPAAPW